MEFETTHLSAFDDFVRVVAPNLKPVPAEIRVAKSHRKTGELGEDRIERLLKKYAPERYRFEVRVFVVG